MPSNYKIIAKECRIKVLELIYNVQTSHIGSCFSAVDIMAVLFEKIDLDKDRFILSAGWKAASLYYFLWKKGRITEDELNSYCKDGSKFIGLAEPIHPDIPFAGGSMCMGIAAGVGFALAKQMKNEEGRVYVLESDGGMQGGITWEAIAIARQNRLDNLVVIVDRNWRQAMGRTEDILSQSNLKAELEDFGWVALEINGHDYEAIETALDFSKIKGWVKGRPMVIIADTIKGKGWKRAEGNNLYHYKAPSKEEYEEAMRELNQV